MKPKYKNKALSQQEIIEDYNSCIPIKDTNEFSFMDWIPIDGKWHHIAIVHSGDVITKYLNGEKIQEIK